MPQLTIDDVIAHALSELDLETKIMLLTGAATFSLHGNDAIGLRPMILSDGPTGVRGSEFVGGTKVALFPNATLLAQAWDEMAAQRVGEMLASEGHAQDVDVFSVRRSTCIARRWVVGCLRRTPRIRC